MTSKELMPAMARQPWTFKSNRAAGKAPRLDNGFRSGLEKRIADDLKARGVLFEYETLKIKYNVPEREATYTPDVLLPNGVILEIKGIFDTADRQKHLLIKKQRPELDIRFLFGCASAKLYKGSPTTYAMWCEKNGFLWCEKTVPTDWLT